MSIMMISLMLTHYESKMSTSRISCNMSGGSVYMGTMYLLIENFPENKTKVMKFIHGVSRIGPNTRAVLCPL